MKLEIAELLHVITKGLPEAEITAHDDLSVRFRYEQRLYRVSNGLFVEEFMIGKGLCVNKPAHVVQTLLRGTLAGLIIAGEIPA